MRSLFFKIFGWFWLTHILIVALLIVTIGPPRMPNKDQFLSWATDSLELYGQQALDALRTKGLVGFQSYQEQLLQRTGMRLFVLDAADRELQGRELPDDAADVAARARQGRTAEMGPDWRTGALIAKPGSRPIDAAYIFVMQLPGRPSLFFASPYRTLLRVLGALCVAGVLCYGLARYLTAPLRNLQRSARALAGGNLSARVGPDVDRRRDEIGDLGQDFNFMAGRLESLVSSQQRLILDMSHELRSPLARLNLALGLAVQRSGAEAQSALDRIGRETERLNDLIERMLILARLQNREAAGEAIELDLSGMLHDVTADAEFEARAQNRAVLLTRCDPCTIRGIPHLLRSAIENVVRNALRHTAESTQAEVSLELDLETSPAPVALIQVRDHGPGVPEGQLEHIFRPFCRVEDDRNRQTGGVGLGLAIAREAVRLHGGTIQAANAPQGGLVVTIRLPLANHQSLSLKKAAAPSLAS